MGKGRMVTESVSPVGRGTVGLLLIKGIPSSASADGGLFVGDELGEFTCL